MENFRFENPELLWLLLGVVALVLLFVLSRTGSHKALRRFGDLRLLRPLMDGASESKLRLKFTLEMLALVSLVVAAARPQFGSKLETVKKQGIEVMVCLDISNSMLAEDIQPNRLEKAKRMLSRLVDDLDNDQVGLIVFAGEAYTQLPITADFVSAKMFLQSIDPRMVSLQGTAIGAAINLAVRSFTPNETSEKAIVLITDGENHEDDATGAAAAALEKGIHTHVIGIGSTQGALLPDGSGRSGSYRKDASGNPVTTRLDEAMAQQIAQAGAGVYAHADNSNSAITQVCKSLDSMKQTELESHVYADYDDKFMYFLFFAFLMLLIDMFVLDKANALLSKIRIFALVGLCMMAIEPASAQSARQARKATREGNSLYADSAWHDAEMAYRRAQEQMPTDSVSAYNLANALVQQAPGDQQGAQKKLEEAMSFYNKVIDVAERGGNHRLASLSSFNAGDICMASQQYQQAVSYFKRALMNNPKDDEARYNLLLAKKLLQQQQDQNQDQNQDQDQKDDQQQQDQQKQDQQQQQDQQDQQQDQQDQQQDQQQQQQQQQQEQQQQQGQMSQQQAEAILNANNRDEQDTQRKVQEQQMQQMQRRKSDKDW